MNQLHAQVARVEDNVASHRELLVAAHEITARLVQAVRSRDAASMTALVNTRRVACLRIAASSQGLSNAVAETERTRVSLGIPGDPSLTSLRASLDSVDLLRDELLARQAECEDALKAGMSECSSQIQGLRKTRGMHSLYGSRSSRTTVPSYLDSKR